MEYNAANRKDIRAAEKAAKRQEQTRAEAVSNIMHSQGERAWMHDLLSSCGVFSTTFTGEFGTSAFNEGKRSVGLQLVADIMRFCPKQYLEMMEEANGRDAARDNAKARRSGDSTDADGGDSALDASIYGSEGGAEEGGAEVGG